jgi:hypothetical protein
MNEIYYTVTINYRMADDGTDSCTDEYDRVQLNRRRAIQSGVALLGAVGVAGCSVIALDENQTPATDEGTENTGGSESETTGDTESVETSDEFISNQQDIMREELAEMWASVADLVEGFGEYETPLHGDTLDLAEDISSDAVAATENLAAAN